jgi:REP element-mobilizing transposase RayT
MEARMRKPRMLQAGATYHVTVQVNRGTFDIKSKADKDLLRSVIAKVNERHPFTLVNFCFMDNHLHLFIKPEADTSLSLLMCVLLSTYTKRWNKRHGKTGHLWRARFFSRIVTEKDDFVNVMKYIDENPVKAHMVSDAREWRYSGLWDRMHGVTGILCDIDAFFADKFPNALPLKWLYNPVAEPISV